MHKIDSLIFDLDGTLWDTCPSCAIGWNNVLRRHAIPFRTIVADDVRRVAGRSHEDCIRTVFEGLPETQLLTLIHETAEEDMKIIAEQGADLFPGVGEGLKKLRERYPLFIVSNCQAGYIETFLKWSGFGPLFQDFECWGRTGLTKAENIRAVITRNSLRSPLYIGDTESDHFAARKAGVPFAFVSYGFGKTTGADLSADSFGGLVEYLLTR